jgi:hypothetical protein
MLQGKSMRGEAVDYFRMRERAERAAALNASCEQVRAVHEEMACAYARLIEREDISQSDALTSEERKVAPEPSTQGSPIQLR